jgi:ATP-binding cassette subfamily F protein uup
MARVEKQLTRLQAEEESLHAELVTHASDFEKLAALDQRLRAVVAEREALEEQWLEAAEAAE